MLSLPTLCAALILASPLQEPSDRELERTWGRLSAEQRSEAIEWFRFEISELDTLQMRLVRGLLGDQSTRPGDWPGTVELPFFAEVQRKKQRKRLTAKSSKVRGALKKYLPEREGAGADPAWIYDWARAGVVAVGDPDDEDVLFQNALAGIPPGLDLARALCLRTLDGGGQRRAMTAFGHAYVDRSGNVFEGLALWDVWASGKKFEVPDADALGIASSVLGTASRWSAPLSSTEQRSLYEAIGEVFQVARRYRDLRESLADVLLLGEPPPLPGYEPLRLNLHALWVWNEEDPVALARELPAGEDWLAYMEDLPKRSERDPQARTQASLRWGQLIADGARVRSLMVQVLQGMQGE